MPVLVRHLLVLLRIAADVVKDFFTSIGEFRVLVLKMSEVWWCPSVLPAVGRQSQVWS